MIFWFWFLIFYRSTRFRWLQMHPSKVISEFLGWLLWYFGFHFSINSLSNSEKKTMWKNTRKQNKAKLKSLDTHPQSMVFLRIHFQHRACGTTSLWLFKFQMFLLLLKNTKVNNYEKPQKKSQNQQSEKKPKPKQTSTLHLRSCLQLTDCKLLLESRIIFHFLTEDRHWVTTFTSV